MHAFSSEHGRSLLTGHSVVRLLIVSYFIALALGVIQGTDVSVLATAILPPSVASLVMSGIVLLLSGLILIGWHRRAAALVLALAMFWSSYLAMMNAPDQNLGAFWRDLALIGALVMTYADGNRRSSHAATDGDDTSSVTSKLSNVFHSTRTAISRPSARSTSKGTSEKTELYRKDLDIVRAS